MSCDECDKNQDEWKVAFYRWAGTSSPSDFATIGIMACSKHATEIIYALNEFQKALRENEEREKEQARYTNATK